MTEIKKRLIDANELDRKIVEMTKEPSYQHDGEDWLNGLVMAMEVVNESPTVDAIELVHGRWIELPGMEPDYKCSECGRSYAWLEPSEAHYCSNCGAKMDEEIRFVGLCEHCAYREDCEWPKLHPKIKLKECPDFNKGDKK